MTIPIEIAISVLIILVMTMVGMDLRMEDFRCMRQYPLLVPGIVIGQWIVLTMAVVLAGRMLDLPAEIMGGAVLVAAAPVAGLSAFYTQLADGHLALAVTVAAVSNVLAIVVTPLVAMLGLGWFSHMSAAADLPVAKVTQQMLIGLVLPLLAGMAIRHRAPEGIRRWRRPLHLLGTLATVAVLVLVVIDQYSVIQRQFGTLLGAAALFTLLMLAVGLFAARISVRSAADRRAIVWGFPARNVALATLIATAAVGHVSMASFIAVLFATQVITLIPLALWMRRRDANPRRAAEASHMT
jgi:BASS family bile acid:Na+ symporter